MKLFENISIDSSMYDVKLSFRPSQKNHTNKVIGHQILNEFMQKNVSRNKKIFVASILFDRYVHKKM